MKKCILLFLCYFCLVLMVKELAFAKTYYNDYYSRNYYNRNYNVLPQDNLKALEKYAFQKSFAKEAELNRLERLEELAFGSIQSGDINTRYNNVENAILSKSINQYNKPTWGNKINTYFTGQPTGITPNLPSYFSQNFIPSYNNSRIEQFNNGFLGNGYRINSNMYTPSSSVRLLD